MTTSTQNRNDLFHQLGKTIPEGADATQALKSAGLYGWNLRKVPLFTAASPSSTSAEIEVPGQMAIVRDNPETKKPESFGAVGKNYTIIQNESLVDLLDTVAGESGATYETAGQTYGGRHVFVSMRLPDTISVGGVDKIGQYLTAMTSHDGSMSTTFLVSPIRFACSNMLNSALGNKHTSYIRVRHTTMAEKVLKAEARRTLGLAQEYFEEFSETAERLANTDLTQTVFEKIIEREFGAPEDAAPATETRAQTRLDTMAELFSDSITHKEVRNTAWAGYNALTEWFDHYSPVRGGRISEADARARKSMFDPSFKDRAMKVILENV